MSAMKSRWSAKDFRWGSDFSCQTDCTEKAGEANGCAGQRPQITENETAFGRDEWAGRPRGTVAPLAICEPAGDILQRLGCVVTRVSGPGPREGQTPIPRVPMVVRTEQAR